MLVEAKGNELLSLKWPSPPRTILLLNKGYSQPAADALVEFAKYVTQLRARGCGVDVAGRHVTSTYPSISLIAEPSNIPLLESALPPFTPLAPLPPSSSPSPLHAKTDLVATFGGDGTILRAASLFASSATVPTVLSFAMGTLGFLGEWKFADHKKAFRELYMSGAPPARAARAPALADAPARARAPPFDESAEPRGWTHVAGRDLGAGRGARVLLRHRLRLDIRPAGAPPGAAAAATAAPLHALNEVLLHRGAAPHLAHVSIAINGRALTEAVGDGLLAATPSGSTAYALSAGGCVLHPRLPALLLAPVCPRSLSFRPLVLPAGAEVVLRLGEASRGREVELSVDGVRWGDGRGLGRDREVRVRVEEVREGPEGWVGGVPCVMPRGEGGGDEGWVGGLNGLLKFNYPFGEDG